MLSLPSISSSTAACPPEGEAFSSFSSIRMRPAALIRGPILKTMSSMVMLCLSRPQILMIDSNPFDGSRLRSFNPKWARIRFSPTRGTISEAMLTTSRSNSGLICSNGIRFFCA